MEVRAMKTIFLQLSRSATVVIVWIVLGMSLVLPLTVLILWSVSDTWFSGSLFPSQFTWRHWIDAGLDASLLAALLRSIGITCLVTVANMVFAIPAAWALSRSNASFRRGVELFILAPLIVPGLLVAAGLGRLFLTLDIAYSVGAVILAQIIGVLPLTIRVLTASFQRFPAEIWWAARSLGASSWKATVYVLLPMSSKALMTVGMLAAVTSFEDFDRSFVVGAPVTETLPVRLYFLLDGATASFPQAAVACLLLIFPILIISFLHNKTSQLLARLRFF